MDAVIILSVIVVVLWKLESKITKFLSGGKSFAPNETKWN